MDGSDDVLPADGTLAHPLPALGAGDHVTALQQDAVDGGVHADLTEVLLHTSTTAGLYMENYFPHLLINYVIYKTFRCVGTS